MAEPTTINSVCGSWIFQAVAGGAVGVGIMVIGLAKWGKKIFGSGQNTPSVSCPYASDHPALQTFMGESMRDRQDMRGFLEDINGKVDKMSGNVGEMKGKLDLLLQGARVRWNSGLIPPEREKG